MASWTFFGRIQPERYPMSWGQPLEGGFSVAEFGLDGSFSILVHAAQVAITLEVRRGSAELDTLRNLALQYAHEIADLAGYTSGYTFDAEIVSVRDNETGRVDIFDIEIPALTRSGNPHRTPGQIPGDLFLAVASSVPVRIVLRNLQLAMRDAIGTGFYCFRAIEAMMQSMKSEQITGDKQAWIELNAVLNLDRSVADRIKRHADLPRHGRISSISDKDRAEVFELTDKIIHRYLEYIRRKREPLLVDEFPLLKIAD